MTLQVFFYNSRSSRRSNAIHMRGFRLGFRPVGIKPRPLSIPTTRGRSQSAGGKRGGSNVPNREERESTRKMCKAELS